MRRALIRMGVTGIAIPIAAAVMASAATAASISIKPGENFNLICDEHFRYIGPPLPTLSTAPWQDVITYTFNLSSMTWCDVKCPAVHHLWKVKALNRRYLDLDKGNFRGSVRLSDGYWSSRTKVPWSGTFPTHVEVAHGYCRKAPYTPSHYQDAFTP